MTSIYLHHDVEDVTAEGKTIGSEASTHVVRIDFCTGRDRWGGKETVSISAFTSTGELARVIADGINNAVAAYHAERNPATEAAE